MKKKDCLIVSTIFIFISIILVLVGSKLFGLIPVDSLGETVRDRALLCGMVASYVVAVFTFFAGVIGLMMSIGE